MTGAGVIFWKKENGKIYVLLAKRACGYGKRHYSTFGGHLEKNADNENNKPVLLNTAIREAGEETGIIADNGSKTELDSAKAYFFGSGFRFNRKPIRRIHVPFYQYYTYECEVTVSEKWFCESWEHETGTMAWYPIDHLPSPMLFAARVNIWQIKHRKKFSD